MNNQEILLVPADFALQEQQEVLNLMVTISWAWYNGSHTMAAKPTKSLELHYTMIPFLIISVILPTQQQIYFVLNILPPL